MRCELAVVLVTALLLCACGGRESTPTPPGSPSPPGTPSARILVVTHTEGFRHDSIPSAEAGIRDLGTESGLFATDFCRSADDVRRLTYERHGCEQSHRELKTYAWRPRP